METRPDGVIANGPNSGTALMQGQGFVRGSSPAMLTLETIVTEIAPTSIPVLLVGESGTGKQMLAQRIHALSPRCDEALLKVTCAAVTSQRLGAELGMNGHAGHQSNRRGPYGQAGTLLLDEISELDADSQRTLLYALPDGDENPGKQLLGSRLISTTGQNLGEEIRNGHFRSDLYFRINGVCLRLPPLRERKEDIPILAEFFLAKHAGLLGRPYRGLKPRTLQIFSEYNWPGNIRELENVARSIVVLGDEDLAASQLVAPPTRRASASLANTDSLKAASRAASRETEREMILRALERTRWNRKRAARELQISYKSLLYKLKQIGLPEEQGN